MRLSEIKQSQNQVQKIKQFYDWAIDRLDIKNEPELQLSSDLEQVTSKRTFGSTSSDGRVWVHVGNRNTADILRTLVHELVHVKQFEDGTATNDMDEEDHFRIEDEANALAGRIMREYGKMNSDIYEGRTGSIQHEVADSLPYAYAIPALNSSNAYDQYKFGVAIASARGRKARDDDNLVPFNSENRKLQQDWADNEVIISFDPHVDQLIDDALNAIGKNGPNAKRLIGVKGSKESHDVPKSSPVKPFKGFR